MKKYLIILLILVGFVFVSISFLYCTAAGTVTNLMHSANRAGVEMLEEGSPLISADNYNKLICIDANENTENYYVNGGITPPLGFPVFNNVTLRIWYKYSMEDMKSNKTMKTFSGGPIIIKMKIKNFRWVVVDVKK